MKSRANIFAILRRLLAALSLLAMTAVFFIPAAARWFGWLPRLQLVPAICAGAVLEIAVLAIVALLFGRLYCSILCPLGIAQDFVHFLLRRREICSRHKEDRSILIGRDEEIASTGRGKDSASTGRDGDIASTGRDGDIASTGRDEDIASTGRDGDIASTGHAEDVAETKSERSPSKDKPAIFRLLRDILLRYVILALFLLAIPFGLTGLLEPYGIFGRFLSVGIRRAGEPAVVTVAWAIGLVALVLLLTVVRARFWCNRICPVGTFLGLFSRFAVFRIRIDADACVKCGACAKRCDKGALSVRADKSIAVDHSSCVACGNCLTACPKGALSWRKR